MKKTFWSSVLLTVLLTACASRVKLDEAPAVDGSSASSGASSGASTQGIASSPNAAQTGLANVVVDKMNAGQGPAGVASTIYFDYDSFVVLAQVRPVIESHARFLKANPQRKANLEGHTDERGGREYNLALGQRRADAVRQVLSLLGVSDSQLEAISYGEEKPIANGSSEEELAKNRRVEIRY